MPVERHYTEEESAVLRTLVRERRSRRKLDLEARLLAARRDCDAIVAMIVREHKPIRIFLWGSLINDRHFSERSDIDIALEGIVDPAELSAIRGSAEKLTRIPLDIVAIEHVHDAYAGHIRNRGRVAYERQGT
jgi:predicted nucleotidyltransferase